MERKIGETFEFEGKWLKVKEEDAKNACRNCYLVAKECSRYLSIIGECLDKKRSDNKNIVFEDITYKPDKNRQQEEQQQEQAEQPQELNLCEILKDYPEGEPFWSPMLGDVKLYDIIQSDVVVRVSKENGETWVINADGTITIGEVTSPEIMLYPSREQRDWTKVKYEKKKELPKTWEDFCITHDIKMGEYFIGETGQIFNSNTGKRIPDIKKTLLPSKQVAEAHLALMQLHQLRDAWREGWLPDWKDEFTYKYVIVIAKDEYVVQRYTFTSCFLSFQDEKRADEFLECFRDLIMKAGDLI